MLHSQSNNHKKPSSLRTQSSPLQRHPAVSLAADTPINREESPTSPDVFNPLTAQYILIPPTSQDVSNPPTTQEIFIPLTPQGVDKPDVTHTRSGRQIIKPAR